MLVEVRQQELLVAWSIFYRLFYLTFVGYLYQYMTYKRKQKSLNGQKKLKEHSMTLKDKPPSSEAPTPDSLF